MKFLAPLGNLIGHLARASGFTDGYRAATPENPRFSLNDPGAWEAFLGGPPSSTGITINRRV